MRTLFVFLALCTLALAGCSREKAASPGILGSAAPSCPQSLATHPAGGVSQPSPSQGETVSATITLTIDPASSALGGPWLQAHPEPLTVTSSGGALRAVGGVKSLTQHPGRFMVELNLVNDSPTGLANVVVTPGGLTGTTAFYDFNSDPLALSSTPAPMALGGIGSRGESSHLRFGFDLESGSTAAGIVLTVTATTTPYVSTVSSPIALTPDGNELWIPFPDANSVAVLDVATNTRTRAVSIPGEPRSVAVTPDGKLVLVASSACNTLSVIDRDSHEVVQIFTEADGIGRDPRHVVLSPDGTHADVSAYVGDVVTALERVGDAFSVVSTIPVGRRPVGMSVTPDGTTVFVAHFLPRNPIPDNEGWVSIISSESMTVTGESILRDDANETEISCLTQVPAFANSTGADLKFEAVPTELAGVFLTPGGAEAWVPGLRLAGFPILEGDVANIGITTAVKGANSPSMNFLLDTRIATAAAFRKTPMVVDFTDRTESFLRCVPGSEDSEGVLGAAEDGGVIASFGVTIPSESTMLSDTGVVRFVAYTPSGRTGLFLSYNADEIAIFDGATHAPLSIGHFMLSGSNPTGMVFSKDGTRAYVAYENSPFVSVLDTSGLGEKGTLPDPRRLPYQFLPGSPTTGATIITFGVLARDTTSLPNAPPIVEVGQIPVVDADPLESKLRRGKVLFTSSNPIKYPALTSIRESSCSSCHPNGGNDGSAWATMEGERRTIGLWGGTANRGWLHASATHASAYDFATTIVKDRFGGTGLSASDADALAYYVAYGIPRLQTPVVDAGLAEEGRALFEASCSSCHGAAGNGSGNSVPSAQYGAGADAGPTLYDIGSATEWAGVTLGVPYADLFAPSTKAVFLELRGDRELGPNDPVEQTLAFTPRPARARGAFKTTAFTNVWENAVFFHDGRVASLPDAINDIAARLGVTFTAAQVDALAAYLTTL